jgi:hypothetical protein
MKRLLPSSVIALFLFLSVNLGAQNPPHPNGGSAPTGSNTPVGGNSGAPVGGGTLLLIGLAGIYAAKKRFEELLEE